MKKFNIGDRVTWGGKLYSYKILRFEGENDEIAVMDGWTAIHLDDGISDQFDFPITAEVDRLEIVGD